MASFAAVGAGFAKNLYNVYALKKGLVQFLTQPQGALIVAFDCQLDEDYQHQVDITDFPVEQGSLVNDHIIVKPFELSFTGVISDTPLHAIETLVTEGVTSIVAATLGPLGTTVGGAGYAAYRMVKNSKAPSVAAYLQLRDLAIKNLAPFTVVTKLDTYKDMLIKSISAPRDNKTGDALTFKIALKQVNIVTAESVNVSLLKEPQISSQESDKGKVQGEKLGSGAEKTAAGRTAGLENFQKAK